MGISHLPLFDITSLPSVFLRVGVSATYKALTLSEGRRQIQGSFLLRICRPYLNPKEETFDQGANITFPFVSESSENELDSAEGESNLDYSNRPEK